jgi:hypothetical protein
MQVFFINVWHFERFRSFLNKCEAFFKDYEAFKRYFQKSGVLCGAFYRFKVFLKTFSQNLTEAFSRIARFF